MSTLTALSQLETLFHCDQCDSVMKGGVAFVLSQCRHSLCEACQSSFVGGNCPVGGCDRPNHGKDIIKDRLMKERLEALLEMRQALESIENIGSHHDEPFAKTVSPHPPSLQSVPVLREIKEKVTNQKVVKPKPKARSKAPAKIQQKRSILKAIPSEGANKSPSSETEENIRMAPPTKMPSSKPERLLNKKNAKGETKLHVACIKGQVDEVKRLLDLGANPNTQDHAGWTPLHEVAQNGHVEILRLLLDSGAAPNVPGTDNVTPLHDAVVSKDVQSVEILVKYGAKKDAINAKGQTPRDLASNEALRETIDRTECDMTASEQLETSLIHFAASAQDGQVKVLPLDLSAGEIVALKGAQSSLGFKIDSKLNPSITHVLFTGSSDLAVDGNAVYYRALLSGKLLLRFNWLETSVKTGELVFDEDDMETYLIKGTKTYPFGAPAKAWANGLQKLPELFDNCHFFFKGDFKPNDCYPDKSQLVGIAQAGGGTVLTREPDPESIPANEQKIPFHADQNGPLAKCSHFIIYQEGRTLPKMRYNMPHIKTLSLAWFFECINNFRLVDPFE
eukprot:TCALIF_02003-PA protein Name:"Similar to Bard1 BRCA1-associated RING domain protein 1 (Mus musculus)" AED:0.05 eAED:0.05 QI:0/1/0.6/1/1/1/5/0/562